MPEIAALLIASCMWVEPGADRYTGSLPAAVDRMDLSLEKKARFKELIARNEYTNIITINAGSDLAIHNMVFGAKGKMCAEINTSQMHGEVQAMVYTVDGESIIRPSVCNNIAQVWFPRVAMLPVPAIPEEPFVQFLPAVPELPGPIVADIESPGFVSPSYVSSPYVGGEYGGGGGGGYVYVPTPITAPVPEPATWLLVGLGLLAFLTRSVEIRSPQKEAGRQQ